VNHICYVKFKVFGLLKTRICAPTCLVQSITHVYYFKLTIMNISIQSSAYLRNPRQ